MNASRTTTTEVEPLEERWLRLTFGDGAVHEVDLADLLQAGGVFAGIRDDEATFREVAVDRRCAARSSTPAGEARPAGAVDSRLQGSIEAM
jgi:Protein of unknown function (DUF2442)